VWARGAAIRPVPSYAIVERRIIDLVEEELTGDEEQAEARLDAAFVRFETTQRALAERLSSVLARPLDETALALGYFLGIAIFLTFERQFGARLLPVDETALLATDEALDLEEQLRAARTEEPVEVEDVIAQEQPAIMAFLHEHVEAALEAAEGPADTGAPRDIDVDDVHVVYRTMLVITLCLSHAVEPQAGATQRGGSELLA
jgi:hypothetical protein